MGSWAFFLPCKPIKCEGRDHSVGPLRLVRSSIRGERQGGGETLQQPTGRWRDATAPSLGATCNRMWRGVMAAKTMTSHSVCESLAPLIQTQEHPPSAAWSSSVECTAKSLKELCAKGGAKGDALALHRPSHLSPHCVSSLNFSQTRLLRIVFVCRELTTLSRFISLICMFIPRTIISSIAPQPNVPSAFMHTRPMVIASIQAICPAADHVSI